MPTRRQRQRPLAVLAMAGIMSAVGGTAAQTPSAGPDRISLRDFRALLTSHRALVVDVRSREVYRSGHIPGAVSVPLADITARAASLRTAARGRTVVTYCSCPAEHASLEAARRLGAYGVAAVRALTGGFPAWVLDGGPVERETTVATDRQRRAAAESARYFSNAASDSTMMTPRIR